MAGMATMAPTGTATRPASTSAASQGKWKLVVKCPKEAAPMAAKARWHSEICPEVRTSNPSDKKRMMSTRALDQTDRSVPTSWGTKKNSTRTTAPASRRMRLGAYHDLRTAKVD